MRKKYELIETERCRLQPFDPADADELLSVFQDPGVRRYLLDDMLVSPEWVLGEIDGSADRFSNGSAGLWAIRLTNDSRIVGFVGFREFFDPPQLQLLYGLSPEAWGRGLATEAAARICDFAFDELGFEEILAATDLPNRASVEVLERLGMKKTRTTRDGESGTAFFRLERSGPSI